MKTKLELTNKLKELGSEREALSKRRDELRADRAQIADGIKTRERDADAAVLDGRDNSKELDELARDKVRLESLERVLAQVDQEIKKKGEEILQHEKGLVSVAFKIASDELCSMTLDVLDEYRSLISRVKALQAKFAEVDRVGAPGGFNVNQDDQLRLLKQIVMDLMGNYDSAQGLSRKLEEIETNYAGILASARSRVQR